MPEIECDTRLNRPYYVYELRDPCDNKVFYVGKGTRNRIDAHNHGYKDYDDNAISSPKYEKIQNIKRNKLEPIRVIIGRYESSAEAFAVEATLIQWVYGLRQLTNAAQGHGAQFIRSREDCESWSHCKNPPYPEIEGIDRPRRPRYLRNGDFSDEQRQQAIRNGIEDKLEDLRGEMCNLLGSTVTISPPDLSTPQDCHILISDFNDYVKIVLKIQLTGKHVQVICISSGTRNEFDNELKKLPDLRSVHHGKQAVIKSYRDTSTNETIFFNKKGIPITCTKIIKLTVKSTIDNLRPLLQIAHHQPQNSASEGTI